MENLLVIGHILNPLNDKKVQFIKDGAILSKYDRKKKAYKIVEIGEKETLLKKLKKQEISVLDFEGEIIMPPFFDMHFHWVQDDVRQMPKEHLLEWLEKYTFPTEMKFNSKTYAEKKGKSFFKKLIKTGTLGGAIYSSIHECAIEAAFKNVVGDFVIGNVQMTMNSPKKLTQTSKEAITLTNKLSKKYKENYAVTPRFAITTDPVTMKEGGLASKKNKSFIQTHLSETKGEIEFVKSIYKGIDGFKDIKTYTDIYNKVGLLTPKTIMGHGIHLSDDELKLLAKKKTAIAHCPTSNAPHKEKGLGSGLFDFKKVEKHKVRWALGSDIGGGPYLSMFDVMRSFVTQNKKNKEATFTKAFYRATLAGAEILNLSKKKGNFLKGKELSFITLEAPKTLKDAETVLKSLSMKHAKKRELYDEMVLKVFYKNNFLN